MSTYTCIGRQRRGGVSDLEASSCSVHPSIGVLNACEPKNILLGVQDKHVHELHYIVVGSTSPPRKTFASFMYKYTGSSPSIFGYCKQSKLREKRQKERKREKELATVTTFV